MPPEQSIPPFGDAKAQDSCQANVKGGKTQLRDLDAMRRGFDVRPGLFFYCSVFSSFPLAPAVGGLMVVRRVNDIALGSGREDQCGSMKRLTVTPRNAIRIPATRLCVTKKSTNPRTTIPRSIRSIP